MNETDKAPEPRQWSGRKHESMARLGPQFFPYSSLTQLLLESLCYSCLLVSWGEGESYANLNLDLTDQHPSLAPPSQDEALRLSTSC